MDLIFTRTIRTFVAAVRFLVNRESREITYVIYRRVQFCGVQTRDVVVNCKGDERRSELQNNRVKSTLRRDEKTEENCTMRQFV